MFAVNKFPIPMLLKKATTQVYTLQKFQRMYDAKKKLYHSNTSEKG